MRVCNKEYDGLSYWESRNTPKVWSHLSMEHATVFIYVNSACVVLCFTLERNCESDEILHEVKTLTVRTLNK